MEMKANLRGHPERSHGAIREGAPSRDMLTVTRDPLTSDPA